MALIPWRCGTCNATFETQTEVREHREENHPAEMAAGVAFQQVIDGGGSDEEAEIAYSKAIDEYRVRS